MCVMRPLPLYLTAAIAFALPSALSAQLRVATLAGSTAGGGYNDGTAATARFSGPRYVALRNDGTLFVADTRNHTIRAIAPDGRVSTIAGVAGVRGSSNGPGSAARFNSPSGIAIDAGGALYVSDAGNNTIRKISASGDVTTLAGTPFPLGGAADGTGAAAQFSFPQGVAVDTAGNVYVADQGNHAIRKITPAGVVTTLAGRKGMRGDSDDTGENATFAGPYGVAVDAAGTVYVADTFNNTIRKVTPAGQVTTLAGHPPEFGSTDGVGSEARFYSPLGIAVDGNGDLYVADAYWGLIRKVRPDGTVTTLAGSTTTPIFSQPYGVAIDASGNVYVADTEDESIRKVTPAGVVTTLAGSMPSTGAAHADGPAAVARFLGPEAVAVDSAGNTYVADGGTMILKITPAGIVSTFAGTPEHKSGFADGTGSTARFAYPWAMAVDKNDNLYVTDYYNCAIRRITPAAVVTTIAGAPGQCGKSDGVGSSARFTGPTGIAIDSHGDIFVADSLNNSIRKIDAAGVVTTFAGGHMGFTDGTGTSASFYHPLGISFDAADNLYVADSGYNIIRVITPAGGVTTIAGSPGSTGYQDGTGFLARFDNPNGVVAAADGTLYVASTDTHSIRKIAPGGVVTTVAGVGGSSGNVNGDGSAARFYFPNGIAMDRAGRLIIADTSNYAVRVATPAGAEAPAITRFDATPAVIAPGGTVTLTWSSTGGTFAAIEGIGSVPLSGSRTVSPGTTTTYTLTVIGPGGTSTATASVLAPPTRRRPVH
jgi:sugar lactone lactonase YvrE